MPSIKRRIGALLGGMLRALDLTRRLVVNLLFLVVLVFVLAILFDGGAPTVEDGSALVAAPVGMLVEQLSGSERDRALMDLLGQRRQPETLMRSLVEAIERAVDDDRIEALVLDLNYMLGGSLTKLRRVKTAVEEFKASGKPVLATGDFYGQSQYYLASLADEVYLHPMGMVLPTGYGSYRRYYKEALDRYSIDWNVFRVGEYKSAVEPYLRNDMSPEARAVRIAWLGQLWDAYKDDVAAHRGLTADDLQDYVANLDSRLAQHGGDGSELALAAGLVDRVEPRDVVRDRLIELVGEGEEAGTYPRVGYRAYLEASDPAERSSENVVAVVVASGTILDGEQPPGTIGGESTSALLRKARESDEVKAVVLRVDSPGGSTFASELIRREVELLREAGKPVVASMGSVAASGGYWISMSADEIWATPATITGSIGIYAMVPTLERALASFGIHNDGVGTTPLAGTLRGDRDLPPQAKEVIQLTIEQGYREFVGGVAEGRGLSFEEVDAIAKGRVWTGLDAHRLGLVDGLGGQADAVAAAAERAGLGDDFKIRYFERREGLSDVLLGRLLSWAARRSLTARAAAPRTAAGSDALRYLAREVELLQRLADPFGALAYCFCDVE